MGQLIASAEIIFGDRTLSVSHASGMVSQSMTAILTVSLRRR
jgi:hypothetical protein